MKIVHYVCPKHRDTILSLDEQPENIKDAALKYVVWPVFGRSSSLSGAIYAGTGGPFYCEKCDKNYFKWECIKL